MNRVFSRVLVVLRDLLRKFSKELAIALALAVVAAIAIEWWNTWSEQRAIQNDLKAVATIEALDSSGKIVGQGSGFFINSTGLLVTNDHVIRGASDVIAKLPSGAYYELQSLKHEDQSADIAILQFDARDTPSVIGFGNSDSLYAGEKVYAIGTPVGQESTVSEGNISNPNQKGFVQFTAPISPGSSGGGLFEQNGSVIGITSAYIDIQTGPQAKEAQNLNFAVPINSLITTLSGGENLVEGSPAFYYSQGTLADNKQQWDQAIADYTQAIKLDDKYVNAYLGLGGDYYEKGDYQSEVKNFLEATKLAPTNPDAFYYLGTAYEDVGEYNNAVIAYKAAMAIDPNYKDAIHDLALVYLVLGDKNSASALVPILARLDPGWGDELRVLVGK